ncbi:MAG TPA: hypothetical protein VK636_16145 [Gemmatimonadaceae bacterium]|nr:hypothetical protein [Gemmatimonadaceae bacterium]
MTSAEFTAKYRILKTLTENGARSQIAQEIALGRMVMVHFLDIGTAAERDGLLARARSLNDAGAAKVFEIVDVDGVHVVVTHFLASFNDLPSWLAAHARSGGSDDVEDIQNAATQIIQSVPRPPTPAQASPPLSSALGGVPSGSPGSFTAAFGAVPVTRPPIPPMAPPASPPASPPTMPRASSPGLAAPAGGSFTNVFGGVSARPAQPTTPPTPVVPPASPAVPPPAAPPPGEFTRVFQGIPTPPSVTPVPASQDAGISSRPATPALTAQPIEPPLQAPLQTPPRSAQSIQTPPAPPPPAAPSLGAPALGAPALGAPSLGAPSLSGSSPSTPAFTPTVVPGRSAASSPPPPPPTSTPQFTAPVPPQAPTPAPTPQFAAPTPAPFTSPIAPPPSGPAPGAPGSESFTGVFGKLAVPPQRPAAPPPPPKQNPGLPPFSPAVARFGSVMPPVDPGPPPAPAAPAPAAPPPPSGDFTQLFSRLEAPGAGALVPPTPPAPLAPMASFSSSPPAPAGLPSTTPLSAPVMGGDTPGGPSEFTRILGKVTPPAGGAASLPSQRPPAAPPAAQSPPAASGAPPASEPTSNKSQLPLIIALAVVAVGAIAVVLYFVLKG